jgi:hypothetical protein
VDVVYKPEDVLESYADLNWPVAFQSNVKTNVTVEDIALVGIRIIIFAVHSGKISLIL